MSRRGTARADAIRRAHQAKAARDAARQHREALIETALTDYYQAAALAERIRDTARRKCGELLAQAERAAAPQDEAAAQAVRRLREALSGVTETAQLCGLTVPAVRDILTGHGTGQEEGGPGQPGSGPSAPAARNTAPAPDGDAMTADRDGTGHQPRTAQPAPGPGEGQP